METRFRLEKYKGRILQNPFLFTKDEVGHSLVHFVHDGPILADVSDRDLHCRDMGKALAHVLQRVAQLVVRDGRERVPRCV